MRKAGLRPSRLTGTTRGLSMSVISEKLFASSRIIFLPCCYITLFCFLVDAMLPASDSLIGPA
jgi:hypothetical protein